MPADNWSAACNEAGTTWDAVVDRCISMALAGILREFPCQISLSFSGPLTLSRPRDLTPVFFGCYDWHSSVHSHWLLIRALSQGPRGPWSAKSWSARIVELLEQQFQPDKLSAEAEFLADPGREGFERPYGLAWLLHLDAELSACSLPQAPHWRNHLNPLVRIAVDRFSRWLPKLLHPIHSGEHSQTAFSLGLILDWARTRNETAFETLVVSEILRLYRRVSFQGFAAEPSGHDFLSPALATADLLRRVMLPNEFLHWLKSGLSPADELLHRWSPLVATDLHDGKLAHLAGLNFSRAWMANGIASALPDGDETRETFEQIAYSHVVAGLPAINSEEYAVTHWVGSFVMSALTERRLLPQ